MRLGKLTKEQYDNGNVIIHGNISTYEYNLSITLQENKDRKNENSPSHLIYARGKQGNHFHAGSAWQGVTKEEKPMFTLAIHIPALHEEEVRYMAWGEGDGHFTITESKPQQEAA